MSQPGHLVSQALAGLATLPLPDPALQVIVVVPARDEAPRIAACLHALGAQCDIPAGSYEVIVLLDGCRDHTLQVIQQTNPFLRPAVHAVTLLEPQGVGRAHRLGMDIAHRRLTQIGARHALIASTDADSTIAPDWLSEQLALAEQGAAAIGGLIELDPTERQALDPHAITTRELGAAQRLVGAIEQSAGATVEHPHSSGVSLALTAAAYERCGGLPVRAALEDEALAQALARQGITIHRRRRVTLLGAVNVIIEELNIPEELAGRRLFLTAFPVLLAGCGGA